jgi:hypothetical protein
MIDRQKLADLPRTKPLRVTTATESTEGTCVINGCPIQSGTYKVNLPQRSGKACAGCAFDHGFTLDWSYR